MATTSTRRCCKTIWAAACSICTASRRSSTLIFAGLLQLEPQWRGPVAAAVWTIAALSTFLLMYLTATTMGVRSRLAGCCTLLFMVSPAAILYEKWFFSSEIRGLPARPHLVLLGDVSQERRECRTGSYSPRLGAARPPPSDVPPVCLRGGYPHDMAAPALELEARAEHRSVAAPPRCLLERQKLRAVQRDREQHLAWHEHGQDLERGVHHLTTRRFAEEGCHHRTSRSIRSSNDISVLSTQGIRRCGC